MAIQHKQTTFHKWSSSQAKRPKFSAETDQHYGVDKLLVIKRHKELGNNATAFYSNRDLKEYIKFLQEIADSGHFK